jgi:hypothetical protein
MESSREAAKPAPLKPEPSRPEPSRLEQATPEPATAEQAKLGEPELEPPTLTSQTTQNAIKLAGEALLPGASLLMDGKILQGGIHLLAGAVAKAFLGPIGIAVVIANSYSNSTTGKNLLTQLARFVPRKPE